MSFWKTEFFHKIITIFTESQLGAETTVELFTRMSTNDDSNAGFPFFEPDNYLGWLVHLKARLRDPDYPSGTSLGMALKASGCRSRYSLKKSSARSKPLAVAVYLAK